MSNYNAERGEIKLPTKEFARFRRALVEAHNRAQEKAHADAVRIHAEMLKRAKGRRMKPGDWNDLYDRLFYPRRYGDRFGIEIANADAIRDALWPGGRAGLSRPKRPLKKDFPTKPVTKTVVLRAGPEGAVTFVKPNLVHWRVEENNHAVERARESVVGREFFRLLGKVKWVRGTGGSIEYQDEYQRDAWVGPSTRECYGPQGERVWVLR
jgi:hypothetical protein